MNNLFTFTLTQTENVGNIQNRIFIDFQRDKYFLENKTECSICFKLVGEKEILKEKFEISEATKLSEALQHIISKLGEFPTKGVPEIKLSIENKFLLIMRYTNEWNYNLKIGTSVFRFQPADLQQLNSLVIKALEINNSQIL